LKTTLKAGKIGLKTVLRAVRELLGLKIEIPNVARIHLMALRWKGCPRFGILCCLKKLCCGFEPTRGSELLRKRQMDP
jgi:hypothetical protein